MGLGLPQWDHHHHHRQTQKGVKKKKRGGFQKSFFDRRADLGPLYPFDDV